LLTLEDRRERLSRSFFHDFVNLSSCLHHMFPPLRDIAVTSRLRSSTLFPRPVSRTKSSLSVIYKCITQLQWVLWNVVSAT